MDSAPGCAACPSSYKIKRIEKYDWNLNICWYFVTLIDTHSLDRV